MTRLTVAGRKVTSLILEVQIENFRRVADVDCQNFFLTTIL
jgi:hypothetical protein